MQAPVGFRIIASGSEFEARVEEVVRSIPPGAVAAYSSVAEQAGRPGAARAVGAVMARSEGLPWHRVVTVAGRLVPGHEAEHAECLRAEGVQVRDGHVAAPIPWWPRATTGSDPDVAPAEPLEASGRRGGRVRSSRGSPR